MSLKHRHFDPISVPAEAGRRRVHRIQCSACPVHADISANTHGGSRAHEDLFRVWRRGGWEIGNNPSRDLCPDCVKKRRQAGKQPAAEAPAPTEAKVIPMPVAAPVTPEPPRAPTFEEKRVINSKLEEVYLDERTGYSDGWSDKRVAEDLAVPRKWVEDLREANFGPARTNEEVKAAVEEAKALRETAQAALAESRRILASSRAVFSEFAEASGRFEKIIPVLADEVSTLTRKIEAIEKAVR